MPWSTRSCSRDMHTHVQYFEWLGTTSTVVLSTLISRQRTWFLPAAQRVGYSILQTWVFDVLREFLAGDISQFSCLPR